MQDLLSTSNKHIYMRLFCTAFNAIYACTTGHRCSIHKSHIAFIYVARGREACRHNIMLRIFLNVRRIIVKIICLPQFVVWHKYDTVWTRLDDGWPRLHASLDATRYALGIICTTHSSIMPTEADRSEASVQIIYACASWNMYVYIVVRVRTPVRLCGYGAEWTARNNIDKIHQSNKKTAYARSSDQKVQTNQSD